MEEKNLIRKHAIEVYLKRFPIILLMTSICTIISLTLSFIVKTLQSAIPYASINYLLSFAEVVIIFQLLYGLNKSLIRLNNDEKVLDLLIVLKDAKSRILAPLYCVLRIFIVALIYFLVIFLVGVIAINMANSIFANNTLNNSLYQLTIILATFVCGVKIIPYEFSFFILAEDENHSISGKQALNQSKKLLGKHVIDYIILLLPIVCIFILIVILFALIDRFVINIFSNIIIYYGFTLLLEALFVPFIRLIEISYYKYLESDDTTIINE